MTTRTRSEILESRYPRGRKMEPGSYSGRKVEPGRRDKYAENLIGKSYYRDTGCNLAPACLSCPFSRCMKEDAGEDTRAERNAAVWLDYKRMKRNGVRNPVTLLCEKYDLSDRSISRILSNARRGEGMSAPRKARRTAKADIHRFLTAGIYKKRAPLPPLFG